MKGNLYALAYAAVLGTVCALLLTAAAAVTAPYRQANAEAEEVLNILRVLQVPLQDDTSARQLGEVFKSNVREEQRGDVAVYVYSPSADQGAIALRFAGPGLWGPIKGFLALEPDMKTIRGVTFYEQEETPGLGGEIVSSAFREQFVGKSIVDQNGNPGIVISSAGETAPNKVDAISGATMTCDKVQAMLNSAIGDILKEKN
ncbi:MAG: FMN-binding protein [Phycisphaerales bacterium]|nr:MAG: FMN-binding protein [Phycisphaerales bacterium]